MTKKTKKKKPAKKTTAKKTKPAKQPEVKIASPEVKPHPTADREVLEFEKNLDEQIAKSETAETKRPRGRPRKQVEPEPQTESAPQLTAIAIRSAVKLPFVLWSNTNKLEQLKLADAEAIELAETVKALLEHYTPNLPASILLWSNFSLVTFAVLNPRLELIRKIKASKKSPPPPQDVGQAGGSSPQPGPANKRRNTFPATEEIKTTQL